MRSNAGCSEALTRSSIWSHAPSLQRRCDPSSLCLPGLGPRSQFIDPAHGLERKLLYCLDFKWASCLSLGIQIPRGNYNINVDL